MKQILQEVIVDLSVNVQGAEPIATLTRGQLFSDQLVVPDTRFVLNRFYLEDEKKITVYVEFGQNGSTGSLVFYKVWVTPNDAYR